MKNPRTNSRNPIKSLRMLEKLKKKKKKRLKKAQKFNPKAKNHLLMSHW